MMFLHEMLHWNTRQSIYGWTERVNSELGSRGGTFHHFLFRCIGSLILSGFGYHHSKYGKFKLHKLTFIWAP